MKNILKITAFIAGVAIITALLDFPFRGGYWVSRGYVADRDAKIAGIQNEPEGQIDVLNVGDSLAGIAITPVEMYRDYGITSYVMNRDLQMTIESYYAIKLALRTQDIKVVLYEVHNLVKRQEFWDRYNIGISEYSKYRSQFIKYHYLWKKLIEGKGIRKYFKGYVVNEAVVPCDVPVPYLNPNAKDVFTLPKSQMYVFDKICDLCRENGIRLVLYSVPSPRCYNMTLHRCYTKMAEEHGLVYLDGNADVEKIGIDMAHDYCDKGGDHLNLFGTRKMTRYLADYLSKECGLTDHRGDPAYRSWSDLEAAYEQEVRDMAGTSYPIIEEELKKSGQKKEDIQ